MYAGYFGLNQAPFSIAPDPRYLFMSERHREALAHLLYGLESGGGFVLLTGEIGTGKTTIGRCFLQQLPQHCSVAYIFNPKLTAAELLQTVCHEFHVSVQAAGNGPPSIKDHLDPLNDYLLKSHASGRQNLLVIDEAQNLSADVLEQLRLLTNLETSERKLLQIVLMGQPELRAVLARPELEQLAQRVIARFHLGPLTAPETRAYIEHRMGVAGLQGHLPFTQDAIRRIHTLSGGVPRRINLLCDRALLGTYARGLQRVDKAVVTQAAREVFDTPSPHTAQAWRFATLTLLALLGSSVSAALLLRAPEWAAWFESSKPVAATLRANDAHHPPATSSVAPQPHGMASALAAPQTPVDTSEALSLPVGPLPGFAHLIGSEATALRELGGLWDKALTGDDPCTSALQMQLQCFRTPRMTLHGLRQLDRPAVLTLNLRGKPPGWVLLSHMDSDTATLQSGVRRWRVPLTVLADAWRGEYATLWRLPPGETGPLRRGNSGPAGQWVARQLQGMQAGSALPETADELKAAVSAFQRNQGLEADGLPGALTLMLINRHSNVAEPRLGATPS